jgi:hypothetical protein
LIERLESALWNILPFLWCIKPKNPKRSENVFAKSVHLQRVSVSAIKTVTNLPKLIKLILRIPHVPDMTANADPKNPPIPSPETKYALALITFCSPKCSIVATGKRVKAIPIAAS